MTIFDNEFLENLKNTIIKCNINKTLISKLLSKTKNIENPNDDGDSTIKSSKNDENSDIPNDHNLNNTEISHEENVEKLQSNSKSTDESSSDIYKNLNTIYSNNKDIEQFLFSIIPLIDKYIQDEANKNLQENSETISENGQTSIHDANNLVENTLIISETQGKVFLPYFISNLKEISKCNDHMPFDEIIEQKYTLPISNFKSLSISRFREAFKLAHYKEKKSIAFSLNLATELMFNYNLHPAIITACRNLDELDIYLDCLENNETEKFKCFDIIFEIPPIISKKAL